MASSDYQKRYNLEFDEIGPVGTRLHYKLELLQLGYTADVEPDLIGGDDPVQFVWEAQDVNEENPNWNVSLRSIIINVQDEAGRLTALSGVAEQELKAVLYGDDYVLFDGWVKPGNYTSDRHLTTMVSIIAVRGSSNLKNIPFSEDDGSLYTGDASPVEILQNIYKKTSKFGVVGTGMFWRPYLTNQLISTHDVLKRLQLNQGELNDGDRAITCWSALNIVLRQYQLQLIEYWDTWLVLQRRREKNLPANTFSMFFHSGEWQSAATYPYYLKIWDTNNHTLKGFTVNHSRPYKYVSVIYNHLSPQAGVIADPGFEKYALEPVSSTEEDRWVPSSGTGIAISAPGSDLVDGTRSRSLELESTYASGGITYPDDFALSKWARIITSGFVEGGSDRSLIISASFRIEFGETIVVGSGVFFALRFKLDTYWLYYDTVTNTYKWSETPANDSEFLVFSPGIPFSGWQRISIPTAPLDDGGNAITGPVTWFLHQPIEDDNGIGQGTVKGRWDDVDFIMLDSDGETVNEAEQRSAIYRTSPNHYGPEPIALLWGTGPTTGHARREKILDGNDVLVDITGDWQYGSDVSGDPSGNSQLDLYATELVKQHQHPLLVGDLTLVFPDGMLDHYIPVTLFRDERILKVSQQASIGSVAVRVTVDPSIDPQKYGVIQPKRNITDGTYTYKVKFIVYVSANTWDVYIDGFLSAQLDVDDQLTQTIDFTWNRLAYSCRHKTLNARIIELLEGDEPDITCSYNVKPGDLLLETIPDLIGTPCFENLVDPTVPDGRIYLLISSGNAGGTGILAESLVQDNTIAVRDPDASVFTLVTLPSAPRDFCINFAEEYIYVVLTNNDVFRYDLSDGKNSVELINGGIVGKGDIVSITTFESGNYAGKVFMLVEADTQPNDDFIYRMDNDGGNLIDIGALNVETTEIHARSSDDSIIGHTHDAGSQIVRWPAAGGVTWTSINNNSITTPGGLAHSTTKNRVLFKDGTTIKFTPDFDGQTTPYNVGDSVASPKLITYDDGRQILWVGGNGIRWVEDDGTSLITEPPFTFQYGDFEVEKIIPHPFDGSDPIAPGTVYALIATGNTGGPGVGAQTIFKDKSLARVLPDDTVETLVEWSGVTLVDMTISWESEFIFVLLSNSQVWRYDLNGENAFLFVDGIPGEGDIVGITHFDSGTNAQRLIMSVEDSNILADDHLYYKGFTSGSLTNAMIVNGRATLLVARHSDQNVIMLAANNGAGLNRWPVSASSFTKLNDGLVNGMSGVAVDEVGNIVFTLSNSTVHWTDGNDGTSTWTPADLASSANRCWWNPADNHLYLAGGHLRRVNNLGQSLEEVGPSPTDIGSYSSVSVSVKP